MDSPKRDTAPKLNRLHCLAIEQDTIEKVQNAINKLATGQALLAADTGTTTTTPVGFAIDKDLIDVQFRAFYKGAAATYCALLFYA